MTLPLFDKASLDLPAKLVNALRMGQWRHRDELARCLGVSVRQIRDAASSANGAILSGQLGLKLTICATENEYLESIGALASQVHQMTTRIVQTKAVFENRTQEKSA